MTAQEDRKMTVQVDRKMTEQRTEKWKQEYRKMAVYGDEKYSKLKISKKS